MASFNLMHAVHGRLSPVVFTSANDIALMATALRGAAQVCRERGVDSLADKWEARADYLLTRVEPGKPDYLTP